MHRLVRLYIKTGIGFLFAGLALGAWMLARREILGAWPHPYLVSAHAHAILVGFVMFLILGVALWLFPRPGKADERYSPAEAQLAYWILAASTGSRFVAETGRAFSDQRLLGYVVLAGGVGQVVGLAVYFRTMWSRIRPVGSQQREARGERF